MAVIKHYEELIERAKSKREPRIAVPCPESDALLQGLKMASGLAYPVLVGDKKKIETLLSSHEMDADIVDVPDRQQALFAALDMVNQGKADMIMKGKTDTPTFMRAMLDKERGIRTGKLLSHITCLEIPDYHKLIFVTDAGLNIRPDYDEKLHMLDNLLHVLTRLGYDAPKIAFLASLEVVHHDMPETFHAAAIAKLSDRGRFGSALVDGPLAIDVAMDPEAVKIKGLKGPVPGDADALFMPDVASGNIFCKSMAMFAHAKMGGFIAGAKVPIVLLSRSDTPERKLYSIAFAVAAS